jgi:hypothetical protein
MHGGELLQDSRAKRILEQGAGLPHAAAAAHDKGLVSEPQPDCYGHNHGRQLFSCLCEYTASGGVAIRGAPAHQRSKLGDLLAC